MTFQPYPNPVGSFEVVEVMAMFFSPIRGHVGLRLCEGDADQVVRRSTLDQKTISSPVALPVARAPKICFSHHSPELRWHPFFMASFYKCQQICSR